MKKFILLGSFVLMLSLTNCQDKKVALEQYADSTAVEVIDTTKAAAVKKEKETYAKPYNEADDAQQKIDSLVELAQKDNKKILLQAGGNWCIWCLRFNNYVQNTPEVKAYIDENFHYYHLNFSPANKNEAVFNKYAPNSDNLGYPFFIILDAKGNVLKVQESGSLEAGESYDFEKVKQAFN